MQISLSILNFIVIGQHTINIPEFFSGVLGFLNLTVKGDRVWIYFRQQEQEKIRKLSSSDHCFCLCKGKRYLT